MVMLHAGNPYEEHGQSTGRAKPQNADGAVARTSAGKKINKIGAKSCRLL
jgi:hypothetical protein